MTCPHCEEMRERIVWLESELGIQSHTALVEKLRPHAMINRGQTAQFIAVLWLAKGKPVSNFQLLEAIPSPMDVDRDPHIVRMWASRARDAIGFFDSVRTIKGFGYQLTSAGVARVAEMLGEPLEQTA